MPASPATTHALHSTADRRYAGRSRTRRAGWASMALVALAWLNTACSGVTVSREAFSAHEAAFAISAPHIRHAVARVDGRRLAAREFSPDLRGRGPTLVLMHGFPDNQHLYDAVIPLLARSHHVVSFDFAGWGASDKQSAAVYDVASQRADLDAVVAHFGLMQVVPVVHDMSGPVGIDWVLDNPGRTHALVLLNTYYTQTATLQAPPAIATFASTGWLRDLRVWGAGRAAGVFESGVKHQMSEFFADDLARQRWVPVLAHGAADIRPAFFSATSVLWREIGARAERVPQMQRATVPVLVLFGRTDPFLNPGVAQALAQQFGRSHLQLVDAGHYVQLDRPADVAAGIQALLASPTAMPR